MSVRGKDKAWWHWCCIDPRFAFCVTFEPNIDVGRLSQFNAPSRGQWQAGKPNKGYRILSCQADVGWVSFSYPFIMRGWELFEVYQQNPPQWCFQAKQEKIRILDYRAVIGFETVWTWSWPRSRSGTLQALKWESRSPLRKYDLGLPQINKDWTVFSCCRVANFLLHIPDELLSRTLQQTSNRSNTYRHDQYGRQIEGTGCYCDRRSFRVWKIHSHHIREGGSSCHNHWSQWRYWIGRCKGNWCFISSSWCYKTRRLGESSETCSW